MEDKYLVGILTLIFLLIYFIPHPIAKFLAISFLLFFAPGFFTLRIYREIEKEEILLIAPPLSIGISGIIALFLVYLSILNPKNILIFLGAYIFITFILCASEDIKKIKISRPQRIIAAIVALSLILISIWGYGEITAPNYKELDIAIENWPQNVTMGENLSFEIYVKNWDYENAHLSVEFRMNKKTIQWQNFTLGKGEEKHLLFQSNATIAGRNLASFNLYLNGNYYTNVHVYFYVNPQ